MRDSKGRFLAGEKHPNFKHGKWNSKEYKAYSNARNRCINPRYIEWEYYGGRGIEFNFTSFEQFFAAIGPCPGRKELDRIDNSGHYEEGNVRWATHSEQNKNKRSWAKKKERT